MDKKRVYTFGNGQAEGKADMRNLLGGKGANLAEMNLIGVPVPPGFTITTEEVQQNVVYEQMNAVGFHIPNAFDKVLAIEKCWLQDDISNRIRNAVRDYAYQHNYSFINLRTHEGMLRNMIVRTSTTGELMVILICKIEKEEEMALFKQMLQYIADTFPEITSLLYIINNKCNDTITDLEVHTFKGKDHIFEEMEGLRFKVGPKSFYQTNSEQA